MQRTQSRQRATFDVTMRAKLQRRILVGLSGLGLMLTFAQAHAQDCRLSPRMHALDFWLGQWDVLQEGKLVGRNTVESTLDGCAVLEHWRDVQGGEGTSLFYYDQRSDVWKQVWITDRALEAGGTKEKVEQKEYTSAGRIRFQGMDRTTLDWLQDGTVRQLIERPIDGGKTWRTTFDAIYQRSPSQSAATCISSSEAVAAAPLVLIDNNNRRDIEGVLAGYTDDATWLSPDQPAVRGRHNFRPRYEALFRDNQLDYVAEISEARADGSIGYAWGKIRGTRTPLDGTAARPIEDTFLAITRCESGRWLVSHLIWSHAK